MVHLKSRSGSLNLSVSIGYSLMSIILIAPIYYQYSLTIPFYLGFYNAMDADLPTLTKFMLRAYQLSFLFCLLVILTAIWSSLKERKKPVLLNISLLICIGWRELAFFALLLPIMQLTNIR